jgi:hypothetical protein
MLEVQIELPKPLLHSHGIQLVDPIKLEKVPFGQSVQFDENDSLEKLPDGQISQDKNK